MSDTETRSRVLGAVDTHEVIELAKELVRIKSYTTEETPVAQFLHGFFQRHSLESTAPACSGPPSAWSAPRR